MFLLTGCGFFGPFPTARIDSPDETGGTVEVGVGDTVRFTGAGSEPGATDGEIVAYDWTFPDEFDLDSDPDEEVQTGSFNTAGDYIVKLKVTDDNGYADKDQIDVEVS